MATEVTFDPQGTPTSVTDAFYKAQDQRMSMMERAQALKNQTLAQKINETELAQWEVEAPLRAKQLQLNIADTGAKLFSTNLTLDEDTSIAQRLPEFSDRLTKARSIKDAQGQTDWKAVHEEMGKIAADLYPFTMSQQANNMLKGIQFEQQQAAVMYGNELTKQWHMSLAEIRRDTAKNKPLDRTGALTQEEINEFEAQTGKPSGFQVGNVKRISYHPDGSISIGDPSNQYLPAQAQGNVEFEKQFGKDLADRVNTANISSQKASQAADSLLVDINTLGSIS